MADVWDGTQEARHDYQVARQGERGRCMTGYVAEWWKYLPEQVPPAEVLGRILEELELRYCRCEFKN